MSRKSNIIVKEDRGHLQEYVETEDELFGLGLRIPKMKTQAFPSLANFQPALPMSDIRRIVESQEFEFGRKWFDSSWITYQNGYGSCAAHGATTPLSKVRHMSGQKRIELSPEYLYGLVNDGRDQGAMLDDVMHAIMNNGVCLRETVPMDQIFRKQQNTTKADKEALRFRGHECYATPEEQSLATALAVLKVPVVIAIHVTNDWRKFDADDVLSSRNDGPGNHCEHVDDIKYDNKRGCFLYRKATSHGKNYSDDGYCWITWEDHLKTPSRYHQFYTVPSAIQDPQGDNPAGSEVDDAKPLDTPTITVQKSESCVWCVRWMETEYQKCIDAGYKVMNGMIPGGSGIPKFKVRVNGEEHVQVGFWKFEDIANRIARMRS